MPDKSGHSRPLVLGEHVRAVLGQTPGGFLGRQSRGTSRQPSQERRGVHRCRFDHHLRNLNLRLLAVNRDENVLGQYGGRHGGQQPLKGSESLPSPTRNDLMPGCRRRLYHCSLPRHSGLFRASSRHFGRGTADGIDGNAPHEYSEWGLPGTFDASDLASAKAMTCRRGRMWRVSHYPCGVSKNARTYRLQPCGVASDGEVCTPLERSPMCR